MIDFFFTICSNNYLAQAIVLGNSVKATNPLSRFVIFLADEKDPVVEYENIPHEVLPIHLIEPALDDLVIKYNIIELNTSIKPRAFEFLFNERNAETAIYLDPDTKVFGPFTELEQSLIHHSIVLTPHINTPIPMDGYTPQENLFLKYGIYNLGFIALRKSTETIKFLAWWKHWTYNLGYNKSNDGIFVDQLPLNHAPLFFEGVLILRHPGYNMAPWNLHERYLSAAGDVFNVNQEFPLRFYHFSSFKVDAYDLPLRGFTRFSIKNRPDLLPIHQSYNEELKNAGYDFYKSLVCKYVSQRNRHLKKIKKEKWQQTAVHKKLALLILRSSWFRKLGDHISIHNSN